MNYHCAAERPLSAGLLSCLLITLGVAGCNAKKEYVAPPPAKASVARPAKSAVTSYLELTGNMQLFRSVGVAARVPAFISAGAAACQSIGIAVFSGILASAFLTVLFAPSFYVLPQRFEECTFGQVAAEQGDGPFQVPT
ncbi:MAG: hypothetical protein JO137_19565 [Hyphomicrobiales bacterium]|nr:hypothetical protein [Hyphomicrobiales bacterium]